MKNKYTRRDSLKLMGSAVVGSQLVRGAQPLDAQTDGVRTVRAVSVDEDMRGKIADLDKKQTIVTYCHHGMRSQQAASHLLSMGFEDVHNLQGGIDAWSLHVDPEVPRY